MAFDPPWRLDPLKNIISVGWGSLKYLKIELSYTKSGNVAKANFSMDTNFGIDGIDAFSKDFKKKADGATKDPPIVDPISDDMAQNLVIWSRGYKMTNIENGKKEINTWFVNIGKVKLPTGEHDIKIDFTTPAVDATTQGNLPIYFVFPTFITFYPPDGGGNSVFIDMVTGSRAAADARVAVLNVHSSYEVITVITPSDIFAHLDWLIAAKSYAGRKAFQIDGEGHTTNETDKLKGSANHIGSGSSGPNPAPLPSQRWRVNYNRKTTALTIIQL